MTADGDGADKDAYERLILNRLILDRVNSQVEYRLLLVFLSTNIDLNRYLNRGLNSSLICHSPIELAGGKATNIKRHFSS